MNQILEESKLIQFKLSPDYISGSSSPAAELQVIAAAAGKPALPTCCPCPSLIKFEFRVTGKPAAIYKGDK